MERNYTIEYDTLQLSVDGKAIPRRWSAFDNGHLIGRAKSKKAAVALCAEHHEKTKCRWWAMCENGATHTHAHPILGDVPICDCCEDKLKKIGGK